jgi:hypothetical protein
MPITEGELAPGETIERPILFQAIARRTRTPHDRSGRRHGSSAGRAGGADRADRPFQTHGELWQAVEHQVAGIVERVNASNQAGGLKTINAQYKRYRQGQIAKAEKAVPYAKFLERFTVSMVRNVAMTGRMI